MSPTPRVSVVVPVHNVERYIAESLDSLLAQTLDDIEIIAVEDGSVDDSARIASDYAAAHPDRLRLLTKAPGCLAAARNFGIEHSRGSYIGFADGDDVVEPDMYQLLLSRALSTGADLVIGGLESFNPNTGERNLYGSARPADFGRTLAQSTGSLVEISPSACNKLFSRELFADGGVRFPEGLRYEDLATVFRLMARAQRIEVVSTIVYHYRAEREGSVMNADFDGYLDLPRAFRVLLDGLAEDGQFDALRPRLEELGAQHLFVGRYADLFAHGPSEIKSAFVGQAYRTMADYFPGWQASLAGSAEWPSATCRRISTTQWLLRAYIALPTRVQLGLSRRLGMFQAPGVEVTGV